ncbi:glycosyltransferase, partial [Clostridium sp.]|uniref:glycosyltransferase n=1 Tax=Clostridium sp. TaxID=1506 RepID=UPI003F32A9D0
HVHHPMLIGWVGLYLSKKYNIPTVFTYHTRYEQYLHNIKAFKKVEEYSLSEDMFIRREISNSFLDFSKEIAIPYGVKVFSNKCDVVFAPTDLIKDYLEDMDVKSHVTVLPTGLDKKAFKNKSDKSSEIRKKYIGDKEYLFCSVSRLSKEKNIEFIINGLKSLKEKKGETFKTLIIGDGPLKSKLKKMVLELGLKELVEFVDCVPNDEIMDYYRACDMFLFASKSETQGIVLLEAMGAKNPVVAVNGTGVVDIVKDGVNGYMTNEDINEWSSIIAEIMNDKDRMERLKNGAYETALKYSNERIAKLAESSYEWAIRLQCRRSREYSFQ